VTTMGALVVLIIFVLVAILVPLFGYDSRDRL
jgi:hypothetical protein